MIIILLVVIIISHYYPRMSSISLIFDTFRFFNIRFSRYNVQDGWNSFGMLAFLNGFHSD